ncbi:alpha/beta fold hydrolase [Streptomyces sp. MST-110588]|uniref:thioesterase II family protein n=1 Tax=Streptomyces sp. MST-110588 TaxID=2833628 RepID=UPI001F5E326A|nr:alpha/beta fold hydrolase [Streptomyces sp. MST-110588]UNO40111.1 thioesterase [Streptomyces sp. MST-110588]
MTELLWRFGGAATGRTAPGAGRTFVLAPFGGGSAYALAEWLPALLHQGETALALQYPGRGPRAGEPHARSLEELARQAAGEVAAHTEGPLVLAGHSLGAVLSYEIAVRLESLGREVELLAVSAARPPDMQRLDPAAVLGMSREDWLEELATGDGAGIEGATHADIVDLLVPVLRADYLLLARYRCDTRRTVSCPLLAMGGTADPWVTHDCLDAWGRWTTGKFTTRSLPGGHFYYRERTPEFCRLVRDALPPAPVPLPVPAQRSGKQE